MAVTFIEPGDGYPLKYSDLEAGETYLSDEGDVVIPLDTDDDEVKFARGVGCPILNISDGGNPVLFDMSLSIHSGRRFRKVDIGIAVSKK
jgi:hypothetical protein